jgi:hypothetical protein
MSENLADGNNAFSLVGGVWRQQARTVARPIGDREHQDDDPTGPMLVHAATTCQDSVAVLTSPFWPKSNRGALWLICACQSLS